MIFFRLCLGGGRDIKLLPGLIIISYPLNMASATPEHVLKTLYEFFEKWNFTGDDIIGKIQSNFDININLQSYDEISAAILLEKQIVFRIGTYLQQMDLLKDRDVKTKFELLHSKIHYGQNVISQMIAFRSGNTSGCSSMFDVTSSINYSELKPFQKLLFYLFNFFQAQNLRKHGEYIYEEIKNPHPTRAWKCKAKIIDIINHEFSMINNYSHWLFLTSTKDMDRQLTDHLIRSQDERLPLLKKNRRIFSFRNGIYITKRHCSYDDMFISYTSPEFQIISSDHYVSCRYFDIDFDNSVTSTPTLDSIFHYQNMPESVIEINKMFIGRMLYNIGDLDNWQVILMLLGTGGTGKSTIHNVIKSFYDEDDVAVIGNNFQTTFGMADIYNKFVFIAPEIKRDWKIDQAEFQEIVCGGKLNVNIKHQSSQMIEWTTPGILGGNENPGFTDNALSIHRRIVVSRFDKKVQDVDPFLSTKLFSEIGAILKSCNNIYLYYASNFRDEDIWTWIPSYFKETQLIFATTSNALHAFLESDQVQLSSHNFVPKDIFFAEFNRFCYRNNMKKPRIDLDLYQAPFFKYNIVVSKEHSRTYAGRIYNNITFLLGVNILY